MDDNATSPISPAPNANAAKICNFEFRGDGTEYFKIWIVNLLLSIITLGIYSPWAKVRNARYLYSNLYLDNNNFRYLAEPIPILKSRIIAVAAFIAYSYISQQDPTAGGVLALLLTLAIPFFINKALAFNHRMSAYKNIQFRFSASYGEAFMVIYIWPILGILSLGILYPMAILKMNQYLVKNSAYGTSAFNFDATYKDYGILFLIMIGVGLTLGLPLWGISLLFSSFNFVAPALMVLLYFVLFTYFYAEITNLFYRSLSLAKHRFKAELTLPGLARVFIINSVLTVVTLGLYLPAAKVRMTKYLCDHLCLQAHGSLDNFIAAENDSISALGDQFGDVFDFGV